MLVRYFFLSKLGQKHHCSSSAEESRSRRDRSDCNNPLSFERLHYAHAIAPEWRLRWRFVTGCNINAMRNMIYDPDRNFIIITKWVSCSFKIMITITLKLSAPYAKLMLFSFFRLHSVLTNFAKTAPSIILQLKRINSNTHAVSKKVAKLISTKIFLSISTWTMRQRTN